MISTVLKEKVKCHSYCVTNSMCVAEFDRKGEKSGGDDSLAGLKHNEVLHHLKCLEHTLVRHSLDD